MSTAPNYFEMAARAAGTCIPGKENEYFAHVRSLSVRFQKEHAKMSDFLEAIHKAENGGEKNGNRGWGKFQGTITQVELNPKMANRAFITYTYTDRDEQGNDTLATDTIRTVPTNDPDGHAIYQQAQGLIGHDVIIYKRPDPDFDEEKVNRGRSAKDRKVAPKTVFHIEDLGHAATPAKPVESQRPAHQAPAQQPQGAPPGPAASTPGGSGGTPAGVDETKAAKSVIWSRLTHAAPQAPQQVLAAAAAAGWHAIGNPTTAPSEEQVEQAIQAAFAYLNQAAAAAGAARA